MYNPTAQQIMSHWATTSQDLREAMHDPVIVNQVTTIAQTQHLRETKEDQLGRLVRGVFLGIIHLEDLSAEIQATLGVDARLALTLYQQLEQKIFSIYRERIEENYRIHNGSNVPDEEVVARQSQVVLKETPATVLNLRKKSPLPQTPPIPITITPDTLPSSPLRSPFGAVPATPHSSVPTVSPQPPVVSQPSVVQPAPRPVVPASSPEPAPIMLHQKEELKTVGSTMPSASYKQNTFGGFGGSFRSPFTKKDSLASTTVEVQMPFEDNKEFDTTVPVAVKKPATAELVSRIDYSVPVPSTPMAPVPQPQNDISEHAPLV